MHTYTKEKEKEDKEHIISSDILQDYKYLPHMPDLDPQQLDVHLPIYNYSSRFRIPKWLFLWLEKFLEIYGSTARARYIKQAIVDKPYYNAVIRKLVNPKEDLNEKEIAFVNRVLKEPFECQEE
ncbi:MAG: hypothetical protein ACW99A_02865 [Candidatus Kariarchaeaceae archaeon]|jgi:hypothetical protein